MQRFSLLKKNDSHRRFTAHEIQDATDVERFRTLLNVGEVLGMELFRLLGQRSV